MIANYREIYWNCFSSGFVALMFARYESPGDHRTNVSADYEIQVDLAKNDLKVTPIKKG